MAGEGSMNHAVQSTKQNRALQTSKRRMTFTLWGRAKTDIRPANWKYVAGKTHRFKEKIYWWERFLIISCLTLMGLSWLGLIYFLCF